LKRLANALRRGEMADLLVRVAVHSSLVALGAVSAVGNTINTVFWQVISQSY
jgi:hypothetical protein